MDMLLVVDGKEGSCCRFVVVVIGVVVFVVVVVVGERWDLIWFVHIIKHLNISKKEEENVDYFH